jgi:hypothetical protein
MELEHNHTPHIHERGWAINYLSTIPLITTTATTTTIKCTVTIKITMATLITVTSTTMAIIVAYPPYPHPH